MSVSRETVERLDHYSFLLRKWNPKINLVSKSSLSAVMQRHFADSSQLVGHDPGGEHWVDLGSGGGFPALVVACHTTDELARHYTLVESDQRKSVFLRTVIRELNLNAKVITGRIEEVPPLRADIISARALAPLSELLCYCERHLDANGTALFPKGATHREELKQALETHSFVSETIQSETDSAAVIFKIKDINRG